MSFHTVYVLEMEHQVIQEGEVVDANVSFIKILGPANTKDAIEFFKITKNTSYKNIYGVENKVKLVGVYRGLEL